jgi:transcription antitermination protein NusB
VIEDVPVTLTRRERIDRTRAREWALQVLYRWESSGETVDLMDVLNLVRRGRWMAPRRLPRVEALLETIRNHRDALDRALVAVTRNWRLDRLSRIDRCVLRIGAAEILYLSDVPPRVAIQEAVRLAERYGGNDSGRFVNGVLDALYHESLPSAEPATESTRFRG